MATHSSGTHASQLTLEGSLTFAPAQHTYHRVQGTVLHCQGLTCSNKLSLRC